MSDRDDETDDATAAGTQRLDKWLWFARVIKTRTQAAGLVTEGKVRLNKVRIDKPSQQVRIGDVVTVAIRGHVRVLKVMAPGARRGPPPEARTLFEELPGVPRPPLPGSAAAGPGRRDPGEGRPTKRDRRRIERLTDDD